MAEVSPAQGTNWSICLVPGCGQALTWLGRMIHSDPHWQDTDLTLPLCRRHLAVAAEQAVREGVEVLAEREHVVTRRVDRAQEIHEQDKARRRQQTDGHIYFVRVGDLIKVGWTRDLPARVKSYGASAVFLASYPATRAEETDLHRQLTPARAKGREWYTPGPIVQTFMDETLAKHGQPLVLDLWTRPKTVVAGKRHRHY